MKTPVRFVDLVGKIVAKTSDKLLAQLQLIDDRITGIHYQYGHYNDIRERLLKFAPDQRYPLVALFEDYTVDHRVLGLAGVANVRLLILMTSRKDITREQREQRNFIPILEPIYQELMKQFRLSGFFMMYTFPVHRRIDRPHWGDPELYANKAYLLNEVLDGIEINSLELKSYLPICETEEANSSSS